MPSDHMLIANSQAAQCATFRAHVKKKRLPPHPNIAEMHGHFTDRLPLLEAACCMYPMALPPRLHADGLGRNATLFIVMKKYVVFMV